jgi:hypothetical protein
MLLKADNYALVTLVRQELGIYLGLKEDEMLVFMLGVRAIIYGGVLRDIIAGQPINDVDMVCAAGDLPLMKYKLEKNGFVKVDGMKAGADDEGYQMLSGLFSLQEWRKRDGVVDAKVHVVTPKKDFIDKIVVPWDGCSPDMWSEFILLKFVASVDMSCCGLAFNDQIGLVEMIGGALDDCQNFRTRYFEGNPMQINKEGRVQKMLDRGWNVSYEGSTVKVPGVSGTGISAMFSALTRSLP